MKSSQRSQQEYDGVDLKHGGCPVCEEWEFSEGPAGYFRCLDCQSVWAGDPENASAVTIFEVKV